MKILYVTTLVRTMGFFPEHIKMLQAAGHTVEYAGNLEGVGLPPKCDGINIQVYDIPFSRNPLSPANIQAFRKIKALIKNGDYDLIHTHTPNASTITRLACKGLRKRGLKIYYTAHGFHFYKGAPLKNWLLYYPVEWVCAHFTDKLITINHEDYACAKKHMHAKKVEYVAGVGLNLDEFRNAKIDTAAKRDELGVPQGAFLLLSAGEINKNKNQEVIIRALAKLNNPNIYYVIAGKGPNTECLNNLIHTLGLEKQVMLLGFRSDIIALCHTADIFCFPSKREGLGKASLEAMISGLPIITSNVHGINDYSKHGVTGFKTDPRDVNGFAKYINQLYENPELRAQMRENCKEAVLPFESGKIVERMREIYEI